MDTSCHFFSMSFCCPDIFDSEREILVIRVWQQRTESQTQVWQEDVGWTGFSRQRRSAPSGAVHHPDPPPDLDPVSHSIPRILTSLAWHDLLQRLRQPTQTDGGCSREFWYKRENVSELLILLGPGQIPSIELSCPCCQSFHPSLPLCGSVLVTPSLLLTWHEYKPDQKGGNFESLSELIMWLYSNSVEELLLPKKELLSWVKRI